MLNRIHSPSLPIVQMQKALCAALIVVVVFPMEGMGAPPNILWITAEDMSATLGCYGDEFATTPHIDALAAESVRFTNAFATSPVCSPSRACLINGCPAMAQGTHSMRSAFPIPEDMVGFPSLLRELGYFTSNNVKTDYNSGAAERIIQASWDQSSETAHWRHRKNGQPFFSIFNLMTSHQSRTMVWPYAQFQAEVQNRLDDSELHDPNEVVVPPYYPDTPIVRRALARYYDCVTVMDTEVGAILQQLEEDGLSENTIVFFYSDHGSGMPRHKRALYDSGMRVPLLIRIPQQYQHLAAGLSGSTCDELVSFDDFGPTVLRLAGVRRIPDFMTGRPFLGQQIGSGREYVFGHRDRVDEVIDVARSVRGNRYLYIRNFMPHLPWNQQSAWVDQSELSHEFHRLSESGTMSPAQRQFAGPNRPMEELFDCSADPLNLNNLANEEEHQKRLEHMRAVLRHQVLSSKDVGFLPETEQWKIAQTAVPMEWARTSAYQLEQILDAASLVGTESVEQFQHGLMHSDASIRYWSAVGCTAAADPSDGCIEALRGCLADASSIVQIEAANALARHGDEQIAFPVLAELLTRSDTTELLYTARTVELLGQRALSLQPEMQTLYDRFENTEGDPAWFIRFSTTGFLNRIRSSKVYR